MSTILSETIEPLLKRKVFTSEEEAIRELLKTYILQQISALKRDIRRFERKYGMSFQQFGQYLHERSRLLQEKGLSQDERRRLSQAIMQEEDDWLEWKAAEELLESWLGLRQEVAG